MLAKEKMNSKKSNKLPKELSFLERKDSHYKKINAGVKKRSGEVNHKGYLVAFLYQLMRDELTPGVIEKIARDATLDSECEYSNGWLANYAKDLANRLTKV